MAVVGAVVVVILLFALIAVGMSVRVLREYERGVIFRLGRLIATKGPGLILLIPLIDRMVKVELRTVTLSIPPQEVITRDNVPCRVNAVAYFRVVDQNRAVVEVENYLVATSQISQTALRSVLGKAELDQLLADRERLNEELQKIIDESTEPWGVKVTAVEIKDVEIPEQMQRAMARQAEAERERRAKIINSEGEFQAAQKLTDAADIISTNPASLQLRYLQTLLEIGSNQNTTVVFPLPMDVIEPFLGRADHNRGGSKAKPDAPKPPPHGGRAGAWSRRVGPSPDRVPTVVPPRTMRRPDPAPGRRPACRPRTTRRPIRICPPPAPERAPSPEIRIDQLSGLRTILAPGRAARPDNFTTRRSEPKGPEGCPVLRGQRGDDAAGDLRAAAGRERARHARLADPGGAEPLPGAGCGRGDDAGRQPGGRSGLVLLERRSAADLAALGRTRPLQLAAGDRRPRGADQLAAPRDRDGRARRHRVRRRGGDLARAHAGPRATPPTSS